MKFTVKSTGHKYSILLGDEEVTNKIKNIKIEMEPLELPRVTIDLVVTKQDIINDNANVFVKFNNKTYRIMEEI